MADDQIKAGLERIADYLWSPNALDANGEPANVVDALDRIASGLFAVARAIRAAGGVRGDDEADDD